MKRICVGWPQDNMCQVCSMNGVCRLRNKNRVAVSSQLQLLQQSTYLIAGSIFWAWLGFSGRGWLWGPVRVNAEFLGETHVSSLGCHLMAAAKPVQTLASWVVDTTLEITKPPKYQINKLKMSFFIACRGCLRSIYWQIQTRWWHANVTCMQTTEQPFLIGSCVHLWL